jgi:hypothetical protein
MAARRRDNMIVGAVLALVIGASAAGASPGSSHEQDLHSLGSLVGDNPAAFTGLYRNARGAAVVVFGPGVDRARWRDRLAAAARGHRYRTETCPHDHRALLAIQDEIATKDWTVNKRLPFSVWADPSTCTVRVESDLLTPADVEALADRFGPAVSFDTSPGSHPVLLPGG